MMKRWAATPFFLLVLWEVPASIRPNKSAWVFQATLRKLFSVSIAASTQPWLTSTPTMHCGWVANTPPRKSLHWPAATASTETGFIQFVPLKLYSQHLKDVHSQSQLRARGRFLPPRVWQPFWEGGMCFAMTHLRLIRLLCSPQMSLLSPDLVMAPPQGVFHKRSYTPPRSCWDAEV